MNYQLQETVNSKCLRSEDYNFNFNKHTGYFMRWGKVFEDDPEYSPIGPEIADIEISTICHGVPDAGPCRFCYKSNTGKGKNMSFETYKTLFKKLPNTVTQIAFGIGDLDGNPDTRAIFEYTMEHGVIPNVTINGAGLTDDWVLWLAETCGAVAVSLYDRQLTYDAIDKLIKAGLEQTNIHYALHSENVEFLMNEFIDDYKNDPRLKNLNAIVLLSIKKKGRASEGFERLSDEAFKLLIDKFFEEDIRFGMDSCSAPKFIEAIKDHSNFEKINQLIEPCEAFCFSVYSDVNGDFYPCSFAENTLGWEEGISILETENFMKDIWFSDKAKQWRENLLDNCRKCPIFEI